MIVIIIIMHIPSGPAALPVLVFFIAQFLSEFGTRETCLSNLALCFMLSTSVVTFRLQHCNKVCYERIIVIIIIVIVIILSFDLFRICCTTFCMHLVQQVHSKSK